jgi:ABC-type transport system involved in multi-copper enzyme maturation permease subunit
MFAASGMFFERDPLKLADLPYGFMAFVQNAGVLVAICLAVYLILSPLAGRRRSGPPLPAIAVLIFKAVVVLGLLAYVVYGVAFILEKTSAGTGPHRRMIFRVQGYGLIAGGLCAFIAVLMPFIVDLFRFRARRIWALARLSFKEAIRRKVLWVFLVLLVVLMFASWFIQSKSEDQVRTYVQVVSFSMSVLLLLVAGLLAAFGIPTDMKQQTIHTIVTKPVERFELIVGRFLGYMMLLTLVLIVVSAVGLLYVLRGIDPDAAFESLKARETLYGDLEFEGTKDRTRGTNVGMEWDYRTYIFGPEPQQPTQWAIWKFQDIKGLADKKKVRCEFSFDIYRTTKGRINEGVFCTFLVQTAEFDPGKKQAYDAERRKERQKPGADPDEIDERLAQEYGCYEVASKEIRNFHTYTLDIPGGIFKNAMQHAGEKRFANLPDLAEVAPVSVRVKCESRTQYVGMAKYDLYFRPDYDYALDADAAAKRDRMRFILNYAKGQSGLWFRLCLVVGVAVACSTFLSGLISFLATAFFYLAGLCRVSIASIAEGTASTGGPFESSYRLALRDLGGAQIDETAAFRVVEYSDQAYRFMVRLFMKVLPDVDLFDFSLPVAEGFNIPGGQLAMTALVLCSYLLLCALAAYYLMKWREIASSM